MEPNYNKALIIGNGTSRKGFPIIDVSKKGITSIGCNAIYRTWYPMYNLPSFLVAVDSGMAEEIKKSDYPSDRFYFPPVDGQYEPAEYSDGGPRYRMNAGMVAMGFAIEKTFPKGDPSVRKELYCIGFDFLLKHGWDSNLYDGTSNYGEETRANERDCDNRTRFLDWFCVKNPGVDFLFTYPDEIFETIQVRPVEAGNIYAINFSTAKSELMG